MSAMEKADLPEVAEKTKGRGQGECRTAKHSPDENRAAVSALLTRM
jgi:hypothetical protein